MPPAISLRKDRRPPFPGAQMRGNERAHRLTSGFMDRRQVLGASAAILGALSVGYALLAPASDEEMIAQVLVELGLALSFSAPISNPLLFGSALSDKFESIFTEQVSIRVSEVSTQLPRSRGKLGLAAAQALSRYGSLNVSLSIDELTIHGESAHCEATASLAGNRGGELRSDSRRVTFDFTKQSGDWLIQSALVRASD